MAKASVAAAAATVHLGGAHALETALSTLPKEQRGHIEVLLQDGADDQKGALAQAVVFAPDGKQYQVAYFAQPSVRGRTFFNIPREVLIVSALGGLAFSATLAWYLTKPVDRMRAGFGRLAEGNFKTRLGPAMGRRRDEIADLAHDFDKMAVRLEELVAARDRLLADVSHELRTPLARLNLAIGLARQEPGKLDASLDRIGGEAAKLDEMVGELLTLAKLESGQTRGDDYFNFAEVVKGVIQDARFEASAKGLEVDLTLDPADETFEWIVKGNGKLVSRAIENIVRNALRYSPENGKVTAELCFKAGLYRLTVRDQGPGVPGEQLKTLFKPFGVSADGFGFGLGLAIAQRAIAVHGGAIAANNLAAGGLEMVVRLPAAVDAQG
jgi:two-component system OmpR family sensor kinase